MGRPKLFDVDVAVDRATDLFWCKGFSSTTPNDLLAGLEIGKGSLYHAFTNKRSLFGLALNRYSDLRMEKLNELIKRPGPAKPKLRAILKKLGASSNDSPARGCLAVNTAVELGREDAEAREAVRKIFDRIEGLLVSVVTEGQESGELSKAQPAQYVADLLLSTMIGLQVLSKVADSSARTRRIVDAMLATL